MSKKTAVDTGVVTAPTVRPIVRPGAMPAADPAVDDGVFTATSARPDVFNPPAGLTNPPSAPSTPGDQ